jgi:hypothetical protein
MCEGFTNQNVNGAALRLHGHTRVNVLAHQRNAHVPHRLVPAHAASLRRRLLFDCEYDTAEERLGSVLREALSLFVAVAA